MVRAQENKKKSADIAPPSGAKVLAAKAPAKAQPTAPLNMGTQKDPKSTHDAAEQGIGGAGGSVPFLTEMESSMGESFKNVKAHMGTTQAQESCQTIGAKAYAYGDDVVFSEANPSKHLVAHELAHVKQQRDGISISGGVGQVGDTHEQDADQQADAVVAGKKCQTTKDPAATKDPATKDPATKDPANETNPSTERSVQAKSIQCWDSNSGKESKGSKHKENLFIELKITCAPAIILDRYTDDWCPEIWFEKYGTATLSNHDVSTNTGGVKKEHKGYDSQEGEWAKLDPMRKNEIKSMGAKEDAPGSEQQRFSHYGEYHGLLGDLKTDTSKLWVHSNAIESVTPGKKTEPYLNTNLFKMNQSAEGTPINTSLVINISTSVTASEEHQTSRSNEKSSEDGLDASLGAGGDKSPGGISGSFGGSFGKSDVQTYASNYISGTSKTNGMTESFTTKLSPTPDGIPCTQYLIGTVTERVDTVERRTSPDDGVIRYDSEYNTSKQSNSVKTVMGAGCVGIIGVDPEWVTGTMTSAYGKMSDLNSEIKILETKIDKDKKGLSKEEKSAVTAEEKAENNPEVLESLIKALEEQNSGKIEKKKEDPLEIQKLKIHWNRIDILQKNIDEKSKEIVDKKSAIKQIYNKEYKEKFSDAKATNMLANVRDFLKMSWKPTSKSISVDNTSKSCAKARSMILEMKTWFGNAQNK